MISTPTSTGLTSEILNAFRGMVFPTGTESREKAILVLETDGLPQGKSEEYRFIPIHKNLEKNFSAKQFARVTPSLIGNIQEFTIPDYECNLIVFINGQFQKHLSKIISPKEQLEVKSLVEPRGEEDGWLSEYFSHLLDAQGDGFAALNTAFWRDGISIRIPDNTILEKPVVILQIHDATQEPVVSLTRMLMMVGKGSSARIIEKFESAGVNPVFNSFGEEIVLAREAQLEYVKIQNDHGAAYQVANTCIRQNDNSMLSTFTFSLNGRMLRNNLNINVDGTGCESHFYGLYLLDKDTLADNHTVVDHRQPRSFSNQLYKGVLDGNSKGVFNGKIYVRPHAQKTNAFQSNRNILLSDTATINTKPQLEIWADDVKCSHGCTSGQLDEEALFYLQSRGISKDASQALLLSAFAGEILTPIKDTILRAYLERLISQRLQKRWSS